MADPKPAKKKKAGNTKANGNVPANKTSDVAEKFAEVHRKNLESAKKHLSTQQYESSSDEENGEDSQNLLTSVFKNYAGNQQDLERTQQFLEESMRSGAEICLICIGAGMQSVLLNHEILTKRIFFLKFSVKRADSVGFRLACGT
jgi:hypothetical protein